MSHNTIDLESQRVIDEENAKAEQRSFDGDGTETPSSKKRTTIDIDDDDDAAEKSPKKRKQYSGCWDHFTVITKKVKGEMVKRAQYNHCKHDYAYDPHKNGTNSYNRHMKICKTLAKNADIGDMMINTEAKLQARKIDHMVFREMIAKCIVQHDLPFAYVEYERVRSVWKYLNADVKFISRHTAAADVYKLYESEAASLKKELADLPRRISFTSDLWTSITQEGYMCLTAHYININWKLCNKILAFCPMKPPHSGGNLAMEVLEKWKVWGIEKKVFSITLDNALNNDTMQEILKKQLIIRDDLIAKGQYFHVRCAAHILNLIVQIGLRDITGKLVKIRESVKFVIASEKREILFQKCVKAVQLKVKGGLILDVQTRWNSTFHMLDRALQYREAFGYLKDSERNYIFHPTYAEWNRLSMICKLLQPFNEITKLISGSTYPTSNLYFMQVWLINDWLLSNTNHEDAIIRGMIIPMREKFDKYWDEVSDLFAMTSVFDPRLKLTLAEFCYGKIDSSSCEIKMAKLRSKLGDLFKAYENKSLLNSDAIEKSENQQRDSHAASGHFGNYDDFFSFQKATVETTTRKSSLEMYLDDPPLDFETFRSLDILTFWKDNSQRYGELASMACDLLSIPITTIARAVKNGLKPNGYPKLGFKFKPADLLVKGK